MNLLPLANVVAAGFDWDYLWHWTHDQEFGKALISAVAPIATAAIAALSLILTARRETKQMELSKQAIPPELTRYKTWVEISEKCIELTKFEKNNNFEDAEKDFKDAEKEYLEIKASREAALERATWERKVISTCPSILLQKRLLGISPRVMDGENFDIYNFAYSRIHIILKILDGICTFAVVGYIFWAFFSIKDFFGINMGFPADPIAQNDGQLLFNRIFGPLIILFLLLSLGLVLKAQLNTAKEEYYIRTLVVEKRGRIEISLEKERNAAKNRLRLVSMLGAAEFIYIPWGEGVSWSWAKRILSVIRPMHYVKKGFNGRSDVIWGSYKEENLNGDLKKKLGREDTQVPNSDIPEESQPTPPQG